MTETVEEKFICGFYQGSGVLAQNHIDFLIDSQHRLIRHERANGGASKTFVSSIPDKIEGYTKK